MTIGAIYRPPSADFSKSLEELAYILQKLPKKCTHIMGDFNVDLHKDTSCEVKEFESIMLTNGFLPLISILMKSQAVISLVLIMYLPIVSTMTLLQVQSVKAYHTIYLFFLYLRALTQSTSPTIKRK